MVAEMRAAAKLEQWAESLWAEAAVEYLNGASYRLTPAEEEWGAQAHRRHTVHDPWEAPTSTT